MLLTANESATVEAGQRSAIQVDRAASRSAASAVCPPDAILRHPCASHPSPVIRLALYRLTDLGTLGGKTSRAYAINAAGQVVGEAATAAGATHAFLYADGKMTDLGTLHGGNSVAQGINRLGQIVGRSTLAAM